MDRQHVFGGLDLGQLGGDLLNSDLLSDGPNGLKDLMEQMSARQAGMDSPDLSLTDLSSQPNTFIGMGAIGNPDFDPFDSLQQNQAPGIRPSFDALTGLSNEPERVNDDNFVIEYSFDEITGSSIIDTASDATLHNGQLKNGAVIQASSSFGGNVLYLEGGNDLLAIADAPEINLEKHAQRTLGLWFQVDELPQTDQKQVIYEEGGHVRGLNVYLEGDHLYVGGWNIRESGWDGTYLSTEGIQANEWYHVTIALDASDERAVQADVFSAYLNGTQFGTGEGSALWKHTNNVGIGGVNQKTLFHDGKSSKASQYGFKGSIGEFKLYNRVLSNPEIQSLASPRVEGQAPVTVLADAAIHYRFEEQTGTQVKDRAIENGHQTAYLQNGATFESDDSVLGGVVAFDGQDSYVLIPNTAEINLGQSPKRSIGLWFNLEDTNPSNQKQVLYEEGGVSRGLNIYLEGNQLYVGGWNRREGDWDGTFLSTEIERNLGWQHISIVLDAEVDVAATQAGAFKAFLNGNLFGDGEGQQLWRHTGGIGLGGVRGKSRFHDGTANGNGTFALTGKLGDFQLYNRALSSADIKTLATLPGSEPTEDPEIQLELAEDTAAVGVNTDRVTKNPTVAGTLTGTSQFSQVLASFNETDSLALTNITELVQANGQFRIREQDLVQILGRTLQDGEYTLNLQGLNPANQIISQAQLTFTLDRTAPELELSSPLIDGIHSPQSQLIGTVVDQGAGLTLTQYQLDGGSLTVFDTDTTGQFQTLLDADTGDHQISVEAIDVAGNISTQTIDFTIDPAAFEQGSGSAWGGKTDDGLLLSEGSSSYTQTRLNVELGQSLGSRTLSFDVEALFDFSDVDSFGDRLQVYLLDPNDPGQTLLDQGVAGTPVFELSETGANFQAGAVRFDGTTVEIDVTSLGSNTQGELLFQVLNLDSDTGSTVQVSNLESVVDETGVESPVFPIRRNVAPVGEALDLSQLNESLAVTAQMGKLQFDANTGTYKADLWVRNDGEPISRQVAIVFENLPDGVMLRNASGQDNEGNFYLNLAPSIARGGLDRQALSEVVALEIENPNEIQFDWQAKLLVGGPNQAPIFETLTLPEIKPGEVLKLPLEATDPDGDGVTFSIRSDVALPTGILGLNDLLEFRPKPDQVGSYTFTLVASDGVLEATQEVTLDVVADPVTTTRVSGIIENVDQEPLVGVVIELGDLTAITDANGAFTIEAEDELPSDTLKVRGEGISGEDVYPFIAEKLPLVLGHDVYDGVNNVIDRPIYLPVLDVASGQTVNPTQTVTVTTENIPGAAVTVNAHSLFDQQGDPFSGILSITEVPRLLTPAALPRNLQPDLVVTIQPGEMVFDTPAALSLPNNSGFAPGTLMDLWSINPETGDFDKVGVAQVSDDGSVIETIDGGIRNSSWHFFAPPTDILNDPNDNNRNPDDQCDNCVADGDFTSSVEFHSGAVVETHDLVTYESLGQSRGVTLTYDSFRADPRPIINFGFSNVVYEVNKRLVARISVNNGDFTYHNPGYPEFSPGPNVGLYATLGGEHFWSIPQDGGNLDAALQIDMRDLPSGHYTYTLDRGFLQFSSPIQATSVTSATEGQLIHVNTRNSSFGHGWGLADWQELVESSDGSILLIDGDGGEMLFRSPTDEEGSSDNPGDNSSELSSGFNVSIPMVDTQLDQQSEEPSTLFQSPPGDYSTLERLTDGTFRRTLKDQTIYEFNHNHQISLIRDPNGNETRYLYDDEQQLTAIEDPVGLQTSFTYRSGRVTSITDPAGRVTRLSYDSDGNLVRITDPDGSSRTWSYDSGNHMISETDKRGNREQAFYDFAGRASRAIRKDGSVVQVNPAQVQGLLPIQNTLNVLNAPIATSLGGEAEASYADGNANASKLILDQRGHLVSATDESGQQPLRERDPNNQVTQTADGRGNLTSYTYDELGNLLSVKDSQSSSETQFTTRDNFFGETITAVGFNAQQLLTVDLNQDGHLDLISANGVDKTFTDETHFEAGDSISVLLGKGNGNYHPKVDYKLPGFIQSITAADVNRDGWTDLVTANLGENAISILYGNGQGAFESISNFAIGGDFSLERNSNGASITVGDLNGDNWVDIIATQYSQTFEPPNGGPGGGVTEAAGLSLASTQVSSAHSNLFILLNNGDETFQISTENNQDAHALSIQLGHLNNDDNLDLVFANFEGNTISTRFGNGDGTFAAKTFHTVGQRPDSVEIGDLNLDGNLDLVVDNTFSADTSVLLGNGDGTFAPRVQYRSPLIPSGPVITGPGPVVLSVTLSDINSDGYLDILETSNRVEFADNRSGVNLFTNDGDGTYTFSGTIDMFPGSTNPLQGNPVITVADINEDGSIDVIAANTDTQEIQVFTGDNTGSFTNTSSVSTTNDLIQTYDSEDIRAVLLDDFDDDTYGDLVTVHRVANNSSAVNIRFNNGAGQFGTEFGAQNSDQLINIDADILDIQSADLNGDALPDLVITNSDLSDFEESNDQVSVLFNMGEGNFTPALNLPTLSFPVQVELNDVNQDGWVDIMVANNFASAISVFINQGNSVFDNSVEYQVEGAPNLFLTSGDINQDGWVDLISVASFLETSRASEITVLLNQQNGLFTPLDSVSYQGSVSDIKLGDINQDRRLDLVLANAYGETVSVLFNQSQGRFSAPINYSLGTTLNLLELDDIDQNYDFNFNVFELEDLNRDGQLDLIFGYENDKIVSVLLGHEQGFVVTDQRLDFTIEATANLLALNDIDGDTDFDLVFGQLGEESVGVLQSPFSQSSNVIITGEKKYTYDPTFNQLTSFTDELGRLTLHDIDPENGNTLSVTEVIGEVGGDDDLVTQYTYTNQGQVNLVIDPLGRITDYDYDDLGRLRQTTFALGTEDEAISLFSYDDAGNLISSTDENGNLTTFEYDALNRLIEVIEADPDGAGPLTSPVTSYTYDEAGNLIAQTDARNHTTFYTYDERDRQVSVTDALNGEMIYIYDQAGNIAAEIDELGRKTTYRYDTRNRRIEMIDPEGYRTRYQYDKDDNITAIIDPEGNRTSFFYDARNRLLRTVNAIGGVAQYSYDPVDNLIAQSDENGHITRYVYDELDRLVETIDPLGGVSRLDYDKASNVIASTDELGRVTQFNYDERDRLTTITNPIDGVIRYSYDDVGNLLALTDELNRTTTYTYDSLNRQVSVRDPLNHTTLYTYDAVDNLTSIQDALGRVTSFVYDELDRPVETINPLGDSVLTVYDAVDNVSAISDELGRVSTFTYDGRNLQTGMTDPLGHTTTQIYDGVGNLLEIIDPLGHRTTYGYDKLYRQIRQTDAIAASTFFTYDSVGNLLSLTDPENNTTRYEYDELDRVVADTNELGGQRSYSYDAVDNEIAMTDRNGRVTTYEYDALDRRTKEKWLDSNGGVIRTFESVYDAASQLTAIADPDSSYSYSYDLAGRLTSVDNSGTVGVPNVLLTYTYDAVNNMTSVLDTIGGVERGLETYTYDELDRVVQLTQSGNGVSDKRVDFIYDAASQMTGSIRYASLLATELVVQSDYAFDLAGRLTSLNHRRGSNSIAEYQWQHDAANRVTLFSSDDGVSEYTYDDRDQLTETEHSYQQDEDYTYDSNGNRANDGYETGLNNRLLNDGVYEYEYDAEGNRTKRTEINTGITESFIWDHRNRLIEVITEDSNGDVIESVEYAYDVYNRRIRKTVDLDGDGSEVPQTERFVYDGDHITLVFDGEGNQKQRYLHGPNIDQVLAEENSDDEIRWTLTDNQGSIRDILDNEGNVFNHISYDSFGQITEQTNLTAYFRFGYTGRELDQESGQYYYRSRYFDSQIGRFISEDPIGFQAGDTNIYRYVFNSPSNVIDPFGLDIWIEDNAANEIMFHQSINIGDPSGDYRSFSYSWTSELEFTGVVYEDTDKDISKTTRYAQTTPEQDKEILEYLENDVGNTGYYGPGYVCRDYSRDKFEKFVNRYNLKEQTNEERIKKGFIPDYYPRTDNFRTNFTR